VLGQSAVKAVVEFNWQEFIGKQGKAACCVECGKPLNQLRAIENEVYLAALKVTTVH
jgi:hypothetical protein